MKVNSILGVILAIQVVLSLVCGVLSALFNNNNQDLHTYIIWDNSPAADGLINFASYFVLINTMIPISLIVSMEMVKVTQSYFINCDQFMWSDYRHKGALVKSASLNE